MSEPQLPQYGSGSLADLLPSIGARLGVPGCREDVLGLPEGDRWVVVLIDGLGWHPAQSVLAEAPFLAGSIGHGKRITAGVPSTTVTSLTSLGTGLPPGLHGIAGLTMRDTRTGKIFCPLSWDTTTEPQDVQPMPTLLERARAEQVAVTSVLPARFEGSGLTLAGLRGGRFEPVADETDDEEKLTKTVAAAARGDRSLVYLYDRWLDHAGHLSGTASAHWYRQLLKTDAFLAELRDRLPDDTRLVVTGDHGMVDVPEDHRIVIEDQPHLLDSVQLIGGEARLRQLYTDQPEAVAARWAERMGDLAWVRTQRQAVAEGWFGKPAPRVAGRFGDVLIAMRDDWAVLTHELAGEFSLVGMHGSLTAAEMEVPLVVE